MHSKEHFSRRQVRHQEPKEEGTGPQMAQKIVIQQPKHASPTGLHTWQFTTQAAASLALTFKSKGSFDTTTTLQRRETAGSIPEHSGFTWGGTISH